MERISLIVMMISAVIFIITVLMFSDKQQLKGYNFHPPKELLGTWINADVKSRIPRIIIRCSWGIFLISIGVFSVAFLYMKLPLLEIIVITTILLCCGNYVIDITTLIIYGLIKFVIKILYWIYRAGCWFAGK